MIRTPTLASADGVALGEQADREYRPVVAQRDRPVPFRFPGLPNGPRVPTSVNLGPIAFQVPLFQVLEQFLGDPGEGLHPCPVQPEHVVGADEADPEEDCFRVLYLTRGRVRELGEV